MGTYESLDSITDHPCPRCGGPGKLLVNDEETEPELDREGNLRYICIAYSCGVQFCVDSEDHVTHIIPPPQLDIFFSGNGRIIRKSVRWSNEEGRTVTEKYFGDFPDAQDTDLSDINRMMLLTGENHLLSLEEGDGEDEEED